MSISRQNRILAEDFLKQSSVIYRSDIDETSIIPRMNQKEEALFLHDLESKPLEWMRFFFPNFCFAPFADFHHEILTTLQENKNIRLGLVIARGHAKTTFTQMIVTLYLLTMKKRNVLWVGKRQDDAMEVLISIKHSLETNRRIIHFYGEQTTSTWDDEMFTIRNGGKIKALGKKQSPRGTRNEEAERPDMIVCDDLDDQEECRNSDLLSHRFDTIKQALIGSFQLTGDNTFIFVNNLIAPDSLQQRFSYGTDDDDPLATHVIRVDLYKDREKKMLSWPERLTNEDAENLITGMGGMKHAEREYFNNPILDGTLFMPDDLMYGEAPEGCEDVHFSFSQSYDKKCLIHLKKHVSSNTYFVEDIYYKKMRINEFKELHKGLNFVWTTEEQPTVLPDGVSYDEIKKPKEKDIKEMELHFEERRIFISKKVSKKPEGQKLITEILNYPKLTKTHALLTLYMAWLQAKELSDSKGTFSTSVNRYY